MYPVTLEPSHIINYYEAEEQVNLWQYLKSPYVMMIGFSVVMMYMMKQVPKEELEQYQSQQSDTMKQCQ